MSIPPLCKCQKCGSACLWICTLCSNCIREIEEAMKLEESAAYLEWARTYDEQRRLEREESAGQTSGLGHMFPFGGERRYPGIVWKEPTSTP